MIGDNRTFKLHIGILALAVVLSACPEGHPIQSNPTIECLCTGTSCPAATCNLALSMAPNCVGLIDRAEILISDYLESERLMPNQTVYSCSSFGTGEVVVITVRSDEWQWGPSQQECPQESGTIALVFECSECQTDADCATLGKGDVCNCEDNPECVALGPNLPCMACRCIQSSVD